MKRLTVCLLAIVSVSACGVGGPEDLEGQAAIADALPTTSSQAAATSNETRPANPPATAPGGVAGMGTTNGITPPGVPGSDYLPQDPQPTRVVVPIVPLPVLPPAGGM